MMEQHKRSINYKVHSRKQNQLGSQISDLIKDLKIIQKDKFNYWEEVVGPKIAKIALPVKTKNGVMFVKVQDAVWRFELTRNKKELIDKINLHLKLNSIKDIVFI